MKDADEGLIGRFALFHIFDGKSRQFHLSKILDIQAGFVLLQSWSFQKNEGQLGLPALYPIAVISGPKESLPWKPIYFGDDYFAEFGPHYFAQLFPNWRSAVSEYALISENSKLKHI